MASKGGRAIDRSVVGCVCTIPCIPPPVSRTPRPNNPPPQIRNSYRDHGSVFTVNLFTQKMTFLIGPEAAAAFFKATDKELGQDEVYGFMKPVFGEVGEWACAC